MINHNRIDCKSLAAILLGSSIAIAGPLGLAGCGSDEEEVVQEAPPPPPPPEPEEPRTASIEELMDQYGIDQRVRLGEEYAPDDEDQRIAILEFFDGFARGNADVVRRQLSSLDQRELDALVDNGEWDRVTEDIEMIEVQAGRVQGETYVMARFEFMYDYDYQAQLWLFDEYGGSYEFEAVPTPPGIMSRLSGSDWIAAWHEILEEEMALAEQSDEDLDSPQHDRSIEDDRDDPSGQPGGPQPGPQPVSPPGDGPTPTPPQGPSPEG